MDFEGDKIAQRQADNHTQYGNQTRHHEGFEQGGVVEFTRENFHVRIRIELINHVAKGIGRKKTLNEDEKIRQEQKCDKPNNHWQKKHCFCAGCEGCCCHLCEKKPPDGKKTAGREYNSCWARLLYVPNGLMKTY